MATAGYSATPLAKKLGIKEGFSARLIHQPSNYLELFSDFPAGVQMFKDKSVPKDFIHYFTKSAKELFQDLPTLKSELKPAGMIWISWPKKASKISTDVTEDIIRSFALSIGLVDIKVCAVDEIWSGLKLVIPVKDRGK